MSHNVIFLDSALKHGMTELFFLNTMAFLLLGFATEISGSVFTLKSAPPLVHVQGSVWHKEPVKTISSEIRTF